MTSKNAKNIVKHIMLTISNGIDMGILTEREDKALLAEWRGTAFDMETLESYLTDDEWAVVRQMEHYNNLKKRVERQIELGEEIDISFEDDVKEAKEDLDELTKNAKERKWEWRRQVAALGKKQEELMKEWVLKGNNMFYASFFGYSDKEIKQIKRAFSR